MNTFRPLRELITFRGGGTPPKDVAGYWNGSIPWATVKDFTSTSLKATQDYITDAGLKNSSTNLIPKGHVIIPTRMALGKAAINEIDMAINQDLRALIPKVPLNSRYLMYAVISLRGEIIKKGSGATVKGITQEELYELEIPYPPLDDQIRIAHLLGKVEELITQRKQHLQQLDDLLKSVFLEMFGDPTRNEKGWEKKPLAVLGSINRGVSKHRPRNALELLGGKYPLIQTGEVSNAGTYITSYSQTYSDLGFAQSKLWPSGTLCITIAANIARTGILTFDACFPDSVVGFDPYKNEANVLYVHGLFWFFQALLEKNAPAAAQKNINLEILRGLEVPKPPIDLQNQFAGIVEKIEDIKRHYEQSLTELENLYGALSQDAFKGELDLSRVPLVKVANDQLAIELNEKKLPVEPDPIDARIANLDRAAMVTADGRKRLLQQSFTTWLQNPTNQGTSSMTEFWRSARMNALDYSDEETGSPEFSLADYDALKQWVFDEIAQSRISQTLNTKIVPGDEISSGSEIVLRKAK